MKLFLNKNAYRNQSQVSVDLTFSYSVTIRLRIALNTIYKLLKGLYLPNFFKKIIHDFLIFFDTLNYGWIHLCYLFLLFRTFYVSIFHYEIDSLEEYSLATDIATSFTCLKPQYYTRKSSFYIFSMVENPVKLRITKSRKNLDKQEKTDLEKQTLSYGLQNR